MGLAHLLKILQVPPCLPDARGAMATMVGPSSPSPGGKGACQKRLALGLSYGCLLGMHVDPLVAYVAPTSPAYFPELKKLICVQ
jgi:hypothetical protein